MFKIIIYSILINIPIIYFFNYFSKYIKLYDKPDNFRKFQKKPVALYGGLILIYNLILINIFNVISNVNIYSEIYFSNSREYFSILFGVFFCFLTGLYDDKYNISANYKLFANTVTVFIVLVIDDNLIIRELYFSFLDNPIELKNFSIIFTLLCILLFINSINMFDGINLQCSIYCVLIFIIFIYKSIFINLSISIIISLIFFIYLNFKNKTFLGDSGAQVLGFIISYIFIKSYNLESTFQCDEIFVIMLIPGVDMFRLFISRLVKGRHPFKADNKHIHHLLLKKIGYIKTVFVIQSIIILEIIMYYLIHSKFVLILIFIITYSYLIFRVSKK